MKLRLPLDGSRSRLAATAVSLACAALAPALVVVACGGEAGAPAGPAARSDAAPTAPGATTPARAAAKTPQEGPAPVVSAAAAERRAKARLAAIDEARTLSKAGRHAEAWARLEPLLGELAGAPELRCEAGYVAFRAGLLDRAGPLITEAAADYPAPSDARSRASFAACLFNVGLVAEQAGDLTAAVDAFQRSFSLRANRTVYDHLVTASLARDAASDTATAERVGAIVQRAVGPTPSIDEIVRALDEFCQAQPMHPPRCQPTVAQRSSAPAGSAILEAAVIDSVRPFERYLALRDARGARLVGTLGRVPDYGDAQETSAFRFEEVVPTSPGPELVFDAAFFDRRDLWGGVECEEDDPYCDGAVEREASRRRVVCASQDGALACVAIPTLRARYIAPAGGGEPCDPPAPSEPFGVGWVADVHVEGGQLSTTPRALRVAPVRCPEEQDDPMPNDESEARVPPPRPPAPFATLASDRELQLDRNLPSPPQRRVPQALEFAHPWFATSDYSGGTTEQIDLDSLADEIAVACAMQEDLWAPRCCPFEGDCAARVAQRVTSGSDEAALIEVTCSSSFEGEPPNRARVLARKVGDDRYRAIATIDARVAGPLPRIAGLRLEDALPDVPGLEARFSFRSERSQPAVDQRTKVSAESRSTTDVEVLCTAGEDGQCWAFPVAYSGRHLAKAADGRSAVIGSLSYRLTMTPAGGRLTFAVAEGTPNERAQRLVGTHPIQELAAFGLERWVDREPEGAE